MARILTPEIEGSVKTLHRQNYSTRAILKEQNIEISQSAVLNIINNKGLRRKAIASGQNYKQGNIRTVRTPELVRQLRDLAKQEHPPSQRKIANKFNCSPATVNNIIHKDLELKKYKKQKVLQLTERHQQIRLEICKRLIKSDLRGKNLNLQSL